MGIFTFKWSCKLTGSLLSTVVSPHCNTLQTLAERVPDAFSRFRTFQLIYLKIVSWWRLRPGWRAGKEEEPSSHREDPGVYRGWSSCCSLDSLSSPQQRLLVREEMTNGNEHQSVVPLSRKLACSFFKGKPGEISATLTGTVGDGWLSALRCSETSLHPGAIQLYLKRTAISIATGVCRLGRIPRVSF